MKQIVSGIATLICLIVVAWFFLSLFWFWVLFEFLATLLVSVGCAGEWYLHHHPSGRKKVEKESHHLLESRFVGVVTIGVCMELFVLSHAIKEGVEIDKKITGLANDNLVLSNNNLQLSIELEKLKQPRTVTMEQATNFVFITQLVDKSVPIKICIGQEGYDTETFAHQLRDMFTMARFPIDPSSGPWGITRDPSFITSRRIGNTNESPDLWILFFSTNDPEMESRTPRPYSVDLVSFPPAITNELPSVSEADPEKVFLAINYAFLKMNLKVHWTANNYWVTASNPFAIFVPLRNQ